jgi:hypothetical protein
MKPERVHCSKSGCGPQPNAGWLLLPLAWPVPPGGMAPVSAVMPRLVFGRQAVREWAGTGWVCHGLMRASCIGACPAVCTAQPATRMCGAPAPAQGARINLA